MNNENYIGVKIINSWENYFHMGKTKKLGVNYHLGEKIIILWSKIIVYEIQNKY